MADNTEEVKLRISGDTDGAERALNRFMSLWSDMGRNLNALKDDVASGGAGLDDLAGAAASAGDAGGAASGGLGALLSMILQINPATIVAALGLGGLIRKLNQLKGEVVAVVDQAQTLEINLSALSGTELVKAGEFETVADAMETADLAAEGLLATIQEIGIESPYENSRVVETFRMAMAYGWVSNEAMSLTRSMLDLAAATGKSGYDMQRISINLGQIRSKGKIAGQELRDLAGLGVNLNDILQSQLNVSVEQFNAGLQSGKYTMSDFATAIEEYVGTNFSGAAKRLARTVTGIRSSLQDLKEIAFTKSFKGAGDLITGKLAEGLDILNGLILQSGLPERLGTMLEGAVKGLIDIGEALGAKIVPAVKDLFAGGEAFGDFKGLLGDVVYWTKELGAEVRTIAMTVWTFIKPALAWVANAVRTFPWGDMVKTLRNAINVALMTLTDFVRAIRLLLEGRGAEAFEPLHDAFLNVLTLIAYTFDGFVSNVFTWGYNLVVQLANGIIEAAGKVLTSAMKTVGTIIGWFIKPGSPPKKGPLSHIVEWGRGLMATFAESFKTADFGVLKSGLAPIKAALMDAVSAGDLSQSDYLGIYGAAREEVAALVSYYRQTGEISQDLLGTIYDTLGEGSEELVKYLALQMQYQKATDNLAAIRQEVAEAEAKGFVPAELAAKLKAAEEEAAAIEDEVNWQKQYLDLQRESVDIQLQLIKAMQDLAKATDKLAKPTGGKGTPTPQQPEYTSGLDEFMGGGVDLEPLNLFGQEMAGLSQDFLDLRTKVESFLNLPVAGKIEVIALKLGELTGIDFVGYWEKVEKFIKGPLADALEGLAVRLSERVQTTLDGLTTVWQERFLPALQATYDLLSEFLMVVFGELADWFEDRLAVVTEEAADLWENRLQPAMKEVGDFIKTDLMELLRALAELLDITLALALEKVVGWFEKWGTWLAEKVVPALEETAKRIIEEFQPALEALGTYIDEVLRGVFDWFDKKLTSIYNAFEYIRQIVEAVTTAVKNLATALKRVKTPKELTPGSPTPFEIGMRGVSAALRDANGELAAFGRTSDRLRGMDINARVTSALAAAGGVTIQGGMNFPNVRDGRDVAGVKDALERITLDALMKSKVVGG